MAVRGYPHVWFYLFVNTVILLGGVLIIKESQDRERLIQQAARESCIMCLNKLQVKFERPHMVFGTQTMLVCPACDFHTWRPFPKNPMTVKTIDKDDETNVECYLRIWWTKKTLYGLWMTWQGKVETKKILYWTWTRSGRVHMVISQDPAAELDGRC